MKTKIDETVEGTHGPLRRVNDFLPSPDELAKADEVVKVTIALSAETIAFFKTQAQQHETSYQRMIRRLLDEYVAQHRARERQP